MPDYPLDTPNRSRGDLVFEADSNVSGDGDLVFRTAGVERGRVTAAGIGLGLMNGSRYQALNVGRGVLSESFPMQADAVSTTLTAGTIWVAALGLLAGDVVSKVGFHLVTAAAGTVPTSFVAGIADATGKMMAVTGELKADPQWTAVGQIEVRFSLMAPWTVPASGLYYVVFMQVGAWGTTQPAIGRSNALQISPFAGSFFLWGQAGSGQTVLPAVGANLPAGITASSAPYYVEVA